MLTQPQPEGSPERSLRITRTRQLNRRTITWVLAAALAVLAIASLLPSSSSAVNSIEPEQTTGLSDTSSMSRVSSAGLGTEKSHGPGDHLALTASLSNTSLIPQPLQSGGRQVFVNFDNVSSGTNVGNQYPDVVFSSPNRIIIASSTWGSPSSPPNTVSPCCDSFSATADFIASFPQPVKDLSFTVNACDQIGTSALVDLYQNNSSTPSIPNQKVPCNGTGLFSKPLVSYSGLSNINKVVVHNVTDPLGLAYDNFSFTVPAATPTPTPIPTPTPTPPPAPTNLKALADEEAIDLQWSASPGATGYIIKRTNNPVDNTAFVRSATVQAASATNDESTTFNLLTTITTNTTSFHDATATDPTIRYEYVIAAVGMGGTGPDSQPVWAFPLPRNGCSEKTIAPISAGGDMDVHGGGWKLRYNITPNDGLMIRDVYLNGRRMAARISVPYFRLETQTMGQNSVTRRGQLMPDGISDGLRSRLIVQEVPTAGIDNASGLFFHVVYAIDQMPATPKACLLIAQDFQFFPPNSSPFNPPDWPGPCEPSKRTPTCAKFRPMIHYQFNPGSSDEFLKVINIPQRQHYEVGKFGLTEVPTNHAGLFADADGEINARTLAGVQNDGFEQKEPSVKREMWARGFKDGKKLARRLPGDCADWTPLDNVHQTWKDSVSIPPISPGWGIEDDKGFSIVGPGCPECVHLHWRWGDIQNVVPFGGGKPLLFPPDGSNQQASLDVAVIKQVDGEEDPADYFQLYGCNGKELFGPKDAPVFWYSASSSRPDDYMFWHTAWFKDSDANKSNAKQSLLQGEAIPPQVATQDGPLSINLGDVFEAGENHVEAVGIDTLPSPPPLPAGYAAVNNLAYKITTFAEATGPATIDFGVVSIADQTVFNNLRIFHAEPDPFDPEAVRWVDRTILSPDSPAPNFSTKILTSRTDNLGVYVIGKLVQVIPPSSDRVNLSVSATDGPDPVMAGNILSYTITITNTGPQTAHSVALRDELPQDVFYDSASANQGSCKEIAGTVYCNLNTLNVGASATVTIRVKPRHVDTGNYELDDSVTVRAAEQDDNSSNDTSSVSTTVFPDPNHPPSVVLTTTSASIVNGPASVPLAATATDNDGSIAKVEFFDNGELIGTGVAAGGGNYSFTAIVRPCDPSADHPDEQHNHAAPCGTHALVAVATDNGGRSSQSNSALVFVNGTANVNITSPTSGALASPGGNLTLSATATNSTGSISEVEFLANEVSLGHAMSGGSNQFTFSWTNLPAGNFRIVAVARDGNDVPSRSLPINITIGTAPVVSLLAPLQGTIYASTSSIGISANAISTSTSVKKVDFYANGVLIGTDSGFSNNRFLMTWRQPSDGIYTITAVATDAVGLTSTSPPVNIGINTSAAQPGISVWFDDDLPPGAQVPPDNGANVWYWVDANPGAFSGTQSHQSRNLKQVTAPAIHSHYFQNATAKLHVDPTDDLFTYVFLDANNMPRELMLEWKDAGGSEHRAYWGANNINLGVNGTSSRRFMGQLPRAGEWVRLAVPASLVGFSNNDLDGMKFILDGGRATWDFSGKTAFNYVPQPQTPNTDTNWVDGSLPAGAVPEFPDDWSWIPCGVAVKCHESVLQGQQLHQEHRFKGATPELVNPGDQLFTYVFLDPNNKPDQLFLQWLDGTTWHGAFWGKNFRAVGITGTESWRYMGGLPAAGAWVRLEVPASYVGFEGKFVSGMGYGFFKETGNALITWGRSGKTKAIGPVPVVLSATTPVYQFFHQDFGYYYETKEVHLHSDDRQDGPIFYAHPNKAAGTVAMYRFVNTDPDKREFFYSRCPAGLAGCVSSVWRQEGIAFYVYPDNSEPGTIALHLYHDSVKTNQYFLSTTAPPMNGKIYDGIGGYVYSTTNPLVPARPSFLTWTGSTCQLSWLDNSSDETGFRIEKRTSSNPSWTTVTTVGANVTSKADCTLINSVLGDTDYRVFAFNNTGDSLPSNEVLFTRVKRCRGCVWTNVDTATGDPPAQSDDPSVGITSPLEGSTVGKNLVINANAFDIDGNGSIVKVEFFDGVKLGELTGPPPYNFIWSNIANGPHTLTVKVTDGSGMAATSAPIHITVSAEPSVALTNPASDTVIAAPGTVTLQAIASDADGSVAKVEFFRDDVKIGEDSTTPYSFAWNSVQAGSYILKARVTDNVGLTATSSPVKVTVNSAPSVTLSAPVNGAIVQAAGDVLLVADVVDTDGTINKVEFYKGTTLVGSTTTFPYFYNWTNVPFGNYSLTAKATDDHGAVTTCAPVNLIVNSAPSVSLTSPANLAMLTPSSTVSINASATDPDGTISKVDFYQGTNLIGTDTTTPFSINWNNVASGSYVLSAQATDNRGAVTTSPLVAVTTPTFFDDFNDNSLNTSKWNLATPASPAQVTEQGQQLRITLPASVATYNGITSNATYDMRGATAQVEVAQAVSQAGWVENFWKIESDAQNYFLIDAGAGNTLFRSMVNGVNDQTIIPFDPVAHRFWRVRHNASSNQVSFETSPDAVSWTTRKTVTAGFALTGMRFTLLAGAWGPNNAAPGTAIYNDFQYISSTQTLLGDDYNDNLIDTVKWTANDLLSGFTDNTLPINETLQRIEIGPLLSGTSGSHYRGIRSVNSYNFTGGSCSVELVQPPPTSTTAYAMFTIGPDVDNFYRLYVSGGTLVGERKVGGSKTTLFTISYNAQNHRFLRIRHDPATNNMVMETAPGNGSGPGTWVQQYTQSWCSGIQLATIIFELKGGTSVAEASAPGKVIFDNFSATR